MPEVIQCPKCNRKLRVPDNLLGKKVKCPSCSSTFTATAGEEELPTAPLIEEDEAPNVAPRKPPPRPREEAIEERSDRPRRRPRPAEDEDEYEDETEADDYEEEEEEARPRRRRPIDEEEDEGDRPRGGVAKWMKVRQGLTFILIAICVGIGGSLLVGIVGGVAVGGMAAAAGAGGPGGRPQPGAVMAAAGGGLVMIAGAELLVRVAGQVLTLIGYFFCMNAPQKYNARTLAITALALGGAALVAMVLGFIVSLASGVGLVGMRGMGGIGGAAAIMNLLATICTYGQYFAALLFLVAVARCIRARAVEKSGKTVTILYGVLMASGVVWLVLVILFAGAAAAAAAAGAAPAAAALGGGAIAMVGCGCITGLLALVVFIWYIVLLAQTRAALSNYLARR